MMVLCREEKMDGVQEKRMQSEGRNLDMCVCVCM